MRPFPAPERFKRVCLKCILFLNGYIEQIVKVTKNIHMPYRHVILSLALRRKP